MTDTSAVPRPVRRIVIAGGGLAGWMTAAALAHLCRLPGMEVTVIDGAGADTSVGPFGAVEATLPSIRDFHRVLGLNENELLQDACGSFALGIALSGWSKNGAAWFHPFGDVGANLGPVAFHQLTAKLRAHGVDIRLANFSLAALSAQAGRFVRPESDPRSVLSTYSYGLHLDTRRYANYLQRGAVTLGVVQVSGSVARADIGEDGLLTAVVLTDGRRIEGDLFIDCTGPEATLLHQGLGIPFEDWSHWLPCDRVLTVTEARDETPALYAHAAAHSSGWVRNVPQQGGGARTYIYASSSQSDDEAARAFGLSSAAVHAAAFRSGCRSAFWAGNCVAIGASAAVLEPLGNTSLHLVQSAVGRLIALFPTDITCRVEAAEFNRLTRLEVEQVRDWTILPYKTNGRHGEPFWDQCRNTAVPETLAYKLKLFESLGRVILYDEETFEEQAWICAFDGQGIRARHYDPLAEGIPPEQLRAHFEKLRSIFLSAVQRMPSHGEFLRRHCPAVQEEAVR